MDRCFICVLELGHYLTIKFQRLPQDDQSITDMNETVKPPARHVALRYDSIVNKTHTIKHNCWRWDQLRALQGSFRYKVNSSEQHTKDE